MTGFNVRFIMHMVQKMVFCSTSTVILNYICFSKSHSNPLKQNRDRSVWLNGSYQRSTDRRFVLTPINHSKKVDNKKYKACCAFLITMWFLVFKNVLTWIMSSVITQRLVKGINIFLCFFFNLFLWKSITLMTNCGHWWTIITHRSGTQTRSVE